MEGINLDMKDNVPTKQFCVVKKWGEVVGSAYKVLRRTTIAESPTLEIALQISSDSKQNATLAKAPRHDEDDKNLTVGYWVIDSSGAHRGLNGAPI
jgi:hypothetical protein